MCVFVCLTGRETWDGLHWRWFSADVCPCVSCPLIARPPAVGARPSDAELQVVDDPTQGPSLLGAAELVRGQVTDVTDGGPSLGVDPLAVEAVDKARGKSTVGELARPAPLVVSCVETLIISGSDVLSEGG